MDKLTKGWVDHLRKTARQESASRGSCPLCEAEIQPDLDSFKAHVRADATKHASLTADAEIEEAFNRVTIHGSRSDPAADGAAGSARKRGALEGGDGPEGALPSPNSEQDADANLRGGKKLCSPPASVSQPTAAVSPPTPGRSRARLSQSTGDFDRGYGSKKQTSRHLWNPDDAPARPPHARPSHFVPSRHSHRSSHRPGHGAQSSASQASSAPVMIRQPETRDISPDQLIVEVKGIYSGLVMIESKCAEYDMSQRSKQLSMDQYHALIALHRSLLHEHHDFFLASQHPSANDALRRLASKYQMPARMWRHGIHSFLELLRHKLPASLEHMVTFIYIAYNMIALLYETVPAFKNNWIECLGDLSRYRMAIEGMTLDGKPVDEESIKDRDTWAEVSKSWYSTASDRSPTTGRLYHHRAILARRNALQQLFFYGKALCVPIPFLCAQTSIKTMFEPLLDSSSNEGWMAPVDLAFVRVHGILLCGRSREQLRPSTDAFLQLLDGSIGSAYSGWLEQGCYVAVSLACLMLGYGNKSNALMQVISPTSRQSPEEVSGQRSSAETEPSLDEEAGEIFDPNPGETFAEALRLFVSTYEIVLRRWGDKNTLSFVHASLVFILHLARNPDAMNDVQNAFPWKLTSIMLNYLLRTSKTTPRIDTDEFPGPEKGEAPRPLPEDYAMRGLLYAEDFFPNGWFENEKIDDDERYQEQPSKTSERRERILWIGRQLANHGEWLTWDETNRIFGVRFQYDIRLDGLPDDNGERGAAE
ncbi:hypothetical protein RJ55_01663 [Drechmeria coniospora]|nr:hypothetical protein RJ55_01663 [Drechmeria coniospora]